MSGSGTWSAGVWGQNQWNDLADPTFTVTGIALTASLGDETTVGEINTGWGRLAWNDSAWGIVGNLIAPGQALTGTLGNVVASIDVSTGPSTNNNQLITTALNSVTIDIVGKVFPVGIGMTSTLGTADAGPDAMATGNAMSMGLGSVDAFNQTGWGRQGWNVNAWGVEGQFANVDVTGIAMTAAAGNLSLKGESVVTLNTLNIAQATLGNVDPAPDAMIIGEPMIANLGTALGLAGAGASPTGIAMTAGLGTAVGVPGQEVDVTGLPLNNQLAGVSVKIHIDIQLTGLSLTMNQGSGSALIWNEVNTGSAPITPPGWQEVAA
jgi:hypothetical protein|tara:strand:+ start:551 stop:1516 length:966 start_codon:yes stop_codon:yes gene_type:complete